MKRILKMLWMLTVGSWIQGVKLIGQEAAIAVISIGLAVLPMVPVYFFLKLFGLNTDWTPIGLFIGIAGLATLANTPVPIDIPVDPSQGLDDVATGKGTGSKA